MTVGPRRKAGVDPPIFVSEFCVARVGFSGRTGRSGAEASGGERRRMQQKQPVWLTIVAGILATALAGHLLATVVFVGPDNSARDSWEEPLESYMEPFFQQSWSLFAPKPIGTERALYVRAWYDDDRPTEWVNVSELEIEKTTTHNLAPSRAGRVTFKLASRIGRQHARLTNAEQEALASHYHHDAWERLEDRMLGMEDHSPAGRLSYVLRYDKTITAYATQFAYARWGENSGLRYVQFKTEERQVTPFADRHLDTEEPPRVREFGRRPLFEFDGQDRESFAAAIERFRS